MVVFGADLCFTADAFYILFRQGISVLCRPIAAKYCTVIGSMLYFKMQV